jgi:hypothetical protein
MPAPTVATLRRKKTPGSPGGSQRRLRSGAHKSPAKAHLTAWRLRPVVVAAVGAFLAAYVLDWGAVARLMWACFAGQLGQPACIASFGTLLLLGCMLAWASHRPAPGPVAKTPRKARRRLPSQQKKAVGTGPQEATQSDDQDIAGDTGMERPRKPTSIR